MEHLEPTWPWREYPVLLEAARIIDKDPNFAGARFQQIAEATGLTIDDVLIAARALEADGYVELRLVMPAKAGRIVQISGEARRQVGLWPTPSTALDRMIAALEAIANNTDDPASEPAARA